MSGEPVIQNTLAVAWSIFPLTETPLPCGTKTIAYFAHYQILEGSLNQCVVNELLLALDGQPIFLVESLCRSLADLGVSIVPIPLAPTRSGFPPANEVETRTWSMPDNTIQKTRVDEVFKRQIAGYLAIHCPNQAWTLVDHSSTQRDLDLIEKVFICLGQAYLPNTLSFLPSNL